MEKSYHHLRPEERATMMLMIGSVRQDGVISLADFRFDYNFLSGRQEINFFLASADRFQHRVLRQIPMLQLPFLVLFHQHRTDESADTRFIREDPHHISSSLHFFVEPLKRVGRVQLDLVRCREMEVRQNIRFCLIH